MILGCFNNSIPIVIYEWERVKSYMKTEFALKSPRRLNHSLKKDREIAQWPLKRCQRYVQSNGLLFR